MIAELPRYCSIGYIQTSCHPSLRRDNLHFSVPGVGHVQTSISDGFEPSHLSQYADVQASI